MLKDFKEFIIRGNVLDLAVAVVVGVAFTDVVKAFSTNILMQLVAAIGGKPDFTSLTFKINGTPIQYGAFLTVLINFLIVAFAMFLVVEGVTVLGKMRKPSAIEEAEATEIELLTEIRDALVAPEV